MAPAKKTITSRVLLGEISGAHGMRGEVVVRTFTSIPAAIADYGPLEDEASTRHFEFAVKRVTDIGVVAAISGISDRTAAEKLKGTRLYVDRSALPPLVDGEYYHADLIGLIAATPDGRKIGTVTAVANYGAGDILEVRLDANGKTELIPMQDRFVPHIDITSGCVVVIPPTSPADGDNGER